MTVTSTTSLVETEWLEHHLNDARLRIIDCTVFLPNYFDESAGEQVEVVSGRAAYQAGHIPGSAFIDLVGELTDPTNDRFMFPMPTADQVTNVMSRLGVDADTQVVLYDRMVNIWATRVWWILRVYGFDHAAVLNGGWAKWSEEGRPVSTEPATYPRASFVASVRPDLIATKDEVVAAIGDASICIVNALDPEEYAGRGPVRYGRPGHIPTSVNVSFLGVLNAATAYLPLAEIRQQFEAVAALDRRRVITYCGGGIAASADAFLLTLLGAENVAVYDGSMTEWAADPTLPLVTGDAP